MYLSRALSIRLSIFIFINLHVYLFIMIVINVSSIYLYICEYGMHIGRRRYVYIQSICSLINLSISIYFHLSIYLPTYLRTSMCICVRMCKHIFVLMCIDKYILSNKSSIFLYLYLPTYITHQPIYLSIYLNT